MKQYTLLEIVTSVSDSIDGDPVTTILETDESQQIVTLIEDEYFKMATASDWKHLRVFGQLESGGGASYPNYLKIPDDVESLETIKYNVKEDAADADNFTELRYIEDPSEFLARAHSLTSTESNVEEVTDYGGGTFLITNDSVPEYWTTFDDEYLVFNSYLATLDTTLAVAKSSFVGYKAPVFTRTDGYILDMPGRMFPNFIERCKSVAHADIKQAPSGLHNTQAVTTSTRIHRNASKTRNPRGTGRKIRYGRK